MTMKMTYGLVEAQTAADLVRLVNEQIDEGWEVRGELIILISASSSGFFQAMEKR